MLFVYRVVFFFEKMIMAFHRFRHLRFFKKAKMILRGNCGIRNLRIADQDYILKYSMFIFKGTHRNPISGSRNLLMLRD